MADPDNTDIDKLKLQYVAAKEAASQIKTALDADFSSLAANKDDPQMPQKREAINIDKHLVEQASAIRVRYIADALKAKGIAEPEKSLSAKQFKPEELEPAVALQKFLVGEIAETRIPYAMEGVVKSSDAQKAVIQAEAVKELEKVAPPLKTPPPAVKVPDGQSIA